jgi:hypothetical protein
MSDPRDPGLPSRLLDDVLARPEFGREAAERLNPLGEALYRFFRFWSALPAWVDALLTGVVIAVAIALVLWLLLDTGALGRRRRRATTPVGPAARVTAHRPRSRDLFREGRAARAEGRFADAVVLLFRAIVTRLTERGVLLDDPSRTNREHLRDLARRKREAPALVATLPAFERVRYGGAPAAEDEAAGALAAAAPLFPEESR